MPVPPGLVTRTGPLGPQAARLRKRKHSLRLIARLRLIVSDAIT